MTISRRYLEKMSKMNSVMNRLAVMAVLAILLMVGGAGNALAANPNDATYGFATDGWATIQIDNYSAGGTGTNGWLLNSDSWQIADGGALEDADTNGATTNDGDLETSGTPGTNKLGMRDKGNAGSQYLHVYTDIATGQTLSGPMTLRFVGSDADPKKSACKGGVGPISSYANVWANAYDTDSDTVLATGAISGGAFGTVTALGPTATWSCDADYIDVDITSVYNAAPNGMNFEFRFYIDEDGDPDVTGAGERINLTAELYMQYAFGAPCVATTPADLAAVAASPTQVDLTWTYDGTNNDGYNIYRDTVPSTGMVWLNEFTGLVTAGTYSDTTAAQNTQYDYTVQGYNNTDTCASADSNTANVTTPTCTESTPSSIAFNGVTTAAGDFSGLSMVTPVDLASLEYRITEGAGGASSGGATAACGLATGLTNPDGVSLTTSYSSSGNGLPGEYTELDSDNGGVNDDDSNGADTSDCDVDTGGANLSMVIRDQSGGSYAHIDTGVTVGQSMTNFILRVYATDDKGDGTCRNGAAPSADLKAYAYDSADSVDAASEALFAASWTAGPATGDGCDSAYMDLDLTAMYNGAAGTTNFEVRLWPDTAGDGTRIPQLVEMYVDWSAGGETELLAWNADPQEASAALFNGNLYNLYARGTDLSDGCGNVYYVGGTTEPGTAQAFTWSSCNDGDLAVLTTTNPGTSSGIMTISTNVAVETLPAGVALKISIPAGAGGTAITNAAMTYVAGTLWQYSWNTLTTHPDSVNSVVNGVTIDVSGTDIDCGTTVNAAQVAVTVDNLCNVTATPTVTIGTVTANSVVVNWTSAAGATSYKVSGVNVGNVLTTTVNTLNSNTAYTFNVNGVGTASCDGPIGSNTATTLPGAPGNPTYANATSSSVDVSWTAASGVQAVTYALTRVGGAVVNPATSPETVGSLSPNVAYQFNVAATNATGTGVSSATTTAPYTLAVTPGAATVNGANSNTLNVTIGADANSTATTYAIRINGGVFTNQHVQPNGSVSAAAALQTKAAWGTKTVTGLALATTYTFDIKAANGDAVETTFGTTAALDTLNEVLQTTGGAVTVNSGDSFISVSALYGGDTTNNNDAVIEWELCGDAVSTCDGTTFTNTTSNMGHMASPYSYQIINLTNMGKYQVRVTLIDGDGTVAGPGWVASGADIVYVVTDVIPSVQMLHNAATTGSSKWSGSWGLAGGKYGAFDCDTCHTETTTNIKRIKLAITAPNGTDNFPGTDTVTFTTTDELNNPASTGYGDDSDSHTDSVKVCENCHSLNKYHNSDVANNTGADLTHQNQKDCMECHNHKSGFLPTACDSCHGNPPTTSDVDGSTSTGLTHTDVTGSITPGAHDRHVNDVNLAYSCETCHTNSVMPNGGDININFNAFANTSGTYSGQIGVNYNGGAGTGGLNCTATYCHGGTIGGAAPAWNGAVNCGDCHGATQGAPPSSTSHATHVGTLNRDCSECHGAGYAAGTTAPVDHVSGTVTWDVSTLPNTGAVATYNGNTTGIISSLAPANTDATCANISCHFGSTPNWDTGSTDCGSCHNAGAADKPWPATGAHDAHFAVLGITILDQTNEATVRAACDTCHNGTSALHANGTVNVAFGTTYDDQSAGTPGFGGNQCSNVSCHGGQTTPSWPSATINPDTDCLSCHKIEATPTEYNSPSTGMHAITTSISSKNHGVDLACTECHAGQPSNHFTGLDTPALDAVDNFIAGVTSATCAVSCHSDGGDWARLNDKTKATASNGTECETCHGLFGNWRTGLAFNHETNWDGDANPGEVQSDHSGCKTCHGFNSSADKDAAYNATWRGASDFAHGGHGDEHITMNGPSTVGAGYQEATWNCALACHSGAGNTGHNLADSAWTVNYGDFGAGSCDGCHSSGGSGPTVVWPSNNSSFTGEGYGSHLKATSGDTFSAGTDWTAQCQKCHGFHAGDVFIPENATVGINYPDHGGIYLGGTVNKDVDLVTPLFTTEAEICWSCHATQGVDGEFGINDKANTGSIGYDYGTLDGGNGNVNWIGAAWRSGTLKFGYKDGAIASTHTANPQGAPWNGPTTTGNTTATNPDTVGQIRCSYCHDVHNTTFIKEATVTAQNGAPYLRGTWKGNPYREDGAPQAGDSWTTNSFGDVPRGGTEYVELGGYQIDQNNNYPTSTWSADDSAGLCELCHGSGDGAWTATEINTLNKFGTDSTDWVGSNGHANAVMGGDGSGAANIFTHTDRTTVTPSFGTGNGISSGSPAMAYNHIGDNNSTRGYGFRNNTGDSGDGFDLAPPTLNRYSRADYNWGAIIASSNPTEIGYHKFSCSKCHNPHASRLPRLMITNCLDTKHNDWDDQGAPDVDVIAGTSGGSGDSASVDNDGMTYSQATSAQNCHRVGDSTQGGTGSGWNNVTPW